MRCHNCGNENSDDAKFCGKCGAALARKSGSAKSRKFFLVASLVCALTTIVTAMVIFLHKTSIINTTDAADYGKPEGRIMVLENRTELIRNEDDGRHIIALYQEDLGIENIADMLGDCKVEAIGDNTFYRYSLEYSGIPIYGRKVVLVADRNDMLSSISSGAPNMNGCQTVPAISDEEARKVLERATSVSCVYISELVFYSTDESVPELAYHISYVDEDAGSVFISATDGSVLGRTKDVQTIQARGKDINGTKRPLEIAKRLEVTDKGDDVPVTAQGQFVLADLKRNIYIYDAKGATRSEVITPMELTTSKGTKCNLLPSKTGNGYEWQDSKGDVFDLEGKESDANSWKLINRSNGTVERVNDSRYCYADHLVMSPTTDVDAPSAVTLMTRLTNVYDFYASDSTFSRKSFDGVGGRVNAVCNVDDQNAFAWAPTGSYAQVCCGKDYDYLDQIVIAHEFAHAVQSSMCTLSGSGESGSIQEATSDILGILACDYADNKKMDNSAAWSFPPFRDPSDPESLTDSGLGNKPYPSSYEQDGFWADTSPQSDDSGGIHHNSTVLSHAAYLMCDKKSSIEGEALTTTELGILVMSSFQLVSNPNCDFAMFAGYMGCIARENLSQEKRTRVEKAFEATAIKPGLVAFIESGNTSSNNTAHTTNNDIPRKLVSSYHMTYSSKKWPDQAYEEWVNATYDERGRITHKEITREASFGWEGEPAYSLDFEYDAAGDLLHVTGVERPDTQHSTQVIWNLGYEEGNATLRASGTEGTEPRYINDTYDADENLVTRDYLIRTGQVSANGILTLSYDDSGRITGQTAKTGYNGEQSTMRYYDMSVGYDKASRISSIEVLDSSGKLFSRRTYEYDDAGRLISRNHFYDGSNSNLTVNQSYAYDQNGHLSSIEQSGGDGWWAPAQATFTTDGDGSIVSARIESEDYVRTYEVEYVTISTPKGQEPFNAVDLTNPVNPDLYNELWVTHANLDPTPYDESAFLRENRRWLELHDASEIEKENSSVTETVEHKGVYTLKYSLNDLKKEGGDGHIGNGVYVPGTLGEYYECYGNNQRVIEPEGYYPGALWRRYAPIPGTNLLIEYEDFGETDHYKIDAWGITGPLGELVDGLGPDEQITFYALADGLVSNKGELDAEGMLPDPATRRLEKRGLTYIQEVGQYSYIYYADGSDYAYAMSVKCAADGMLTSQTEVSISINAGIYQ